MFPWHITAICLPKHFWCKIKQNANQTLFENVVFFTIGGSQYFNIICIKIYMITHTLLYANLGVCICAYTFTIFNCLLLRLSMTKGKLFLVLSCIIMQAIQMCVFKYLLYVRVHLQSMSCSLTKQTNMQQWDTWDGIRDMTLQERYIPYNIRRYRAKKSRNESSGALRRWRGLDGCMQTTGISGESRAKWESAEHADENLSFLAHYMRMCWLTLKD